MAFAFIRHLMRKKFATNLLFLIAVNLLIKPYWIFAVDRVVQNKVGPAEYGTYFAVFNVSYIFSVLLDFGINNFNNRAVSRNHNRLGEYIINLMLLKMLLGILYFAGTFLYALSTGMSDLQMKMLFFLAVNQLLLSLVLYARSNIAALQLFKADAFISVLDRLLTIVFCSIVMYGAGFREHFNIMWFVYAQTLALAVTAAIALLLIFSRARWKTNLWQWRFSRKILARSLPFAMLALLMSVYSRVDAVILEKLASNGVTEAGIYAASFRMLDAVNMFGYLFSVPLLPMFASMIRKRSSISSLLKFSAEIMYVFSFAVAILCFLFSRQMMELLYPQSDAYWSSVFAWLMWSFVPMSSVYVFGTLLTANGSMKLLIQIAAAGVLLNAGLNTFLIPHFGALGCAYAAFTTQMVVALLHVFAAQKVFGNPLNGRLLLQLVAFSVLSICACYLIDTLHIHWMLAFSLTALSLGALAAVMGLLPVRQGFNTIFSGLQKA